MQSKKINWGINGKSIANHRISVATLRTPSGKPTEKQVAINEKHLQTQEHKEEHQRNTRGNQRTSIANIKKKQSGNKRKRKDNQLQI